MYLVQFMYFVSLFWPFFKKCVIYKQQRKNVLVNELQLPGLDIIDNLLVWIWIKRMTHKTRRAYEYKFLICF